MRENILRETMKDTEKTWRERETEREGGSLQWDYEREMLMEMDYIKMKENEL